MCFCVFLLSRVNFSYVNVHFLSQWLVAPTLFMHKGESRHGVARAEKVPLFPGLFMQSISPPGIDSRANVTLLRFATDQMRFVSLEIACVIFGIVVPPSPEMVNLARPTFLHDSRPSARVLASLAKAAKVVAQHKGFQEDKDRKKKKKRIPSRWATKEVGVVQGDR